MRTFCLLFLFLPVIPGRGFSQTAGNSDPSAVAQAVANAVAHTTTAGSVVAPANAVPTLVATTTAPPTPQIVPDGTTPPAATRGETTLTLDIAFGIRKPCCRRA